jgi:hypothetical protein
MRTRGCDAADAGKKLNLELGQNVKNKEFGTQELRKNKKLGTDCTDKIRS